MISNIQSVFDGVHRVAIAGHVRPDGDCVGSCMGMYLYLKQNFPQIQADVYMEEVRDVFSYIKDIKEVKKEWKTDAVYDLFLLFDVSSEDRIGVAREGLKTIANTVCIDHHVTNAGIANVNHVRPKASSTCEVLFELLDVDKITKEVAQALYTGIVHDTGVFQYSCNDVCRHLLNDVDGIVDIKLVKNALKLIIRKCADKVSLSIGVHLDKYLGRKLLGEKAVDKDAFPGIQLAHKLGNILRAQGNQPRAQAAHTVRGDRFTDLVKKRCKLFSCHDTSSFAIK